MSTTSTIDVIKPPNIGSIMSTTSTINLLKPSSNDVEDYEITKPPPSRPAQTRIAPKDEVMYLHGPNITTLSNGPEPGISKLKAIIIIATVACTTLLNSMLSGVMVVSLPTMARDLSLPENLILWPASISALASGCTLLIAGSIADVVGGKSAYLTGVVSLTATTIACGIARTGIQLIIFRALQGVAVSLCLPSSVILITKNIPTGSMRNAAFACLGAGQPLGFSFGLVLGGYFAQGIGWRYAYYIAAVLTSLIFLVSMKALPKEIREQTFKVTITQLRRQVDWIGCLLLSTSLGLFSYVLSVLASGASNFLAPTCLSVFSVAVVLIPIFVFYVRKQQGLGAKVIIPPAVWSNRVFTTLCMTVFVIWGVFNAIQYFLALYSQSVQGLSAIQTSIRLIPMVVSGTSTNIATGYLVKHVRADVLVFGSGCLTALAPLLLAIMKPTWSYWACAFFATALTPICADVLFTVANLLITTVFPPQTHGLAGGVFNTISNIGNSVGVALTAVLASSVTMASRGQGEDETQAVLVGYRASFWLCFGMTLMVLVIVALGMRKIGKVGLKMD